MPNEIVPLHHLAFGDMERLAAAVAKSGLFGMKTPEQALVLMAIAEAEGRHPALAARDYDIIANRPSKKAEAMARDFLEAGGKIEWHKLDDNAAEATFSHPQGGKARIGWDMKRAAQASLAGKDMWKKFPRQMLRSRCISEGVRTVWPSATSGLYEPGEVRDFTGTTIDHEPEPETPPEKPASTDRERINAEVLLEPQPQRMTWPQLLDSFDLAIKDATTAEEIQHILRSKQMTETKAHIGRARSEHQLRFDQIMQLADERLAALEGGVDEATDDELPEIVGEEKVLAG